MCIVNVMCVNAVLANQCAQLMLLTKLYEIPQGHIVVGLVLKRNVCRANSEMLS